MKTGIHWFRQGLRLHDNPALVECLDEVQRFVPIYIYDGKSSDVEIIGYNRFRFMVQSLRDLERQFEEFGIKFFFFHGEPIEVLGRLIKEWDVKVISFERDSEAIWQPRDNAVKELCKQNGVQVFEKVSHTLYDQKEIFNLNNDGPPNTCEDLRSTCFDIIGQPDKPLTKPDLAFIGKNLLSNIDLYDEHIHMIPDLDYFDIKPECKEQEEQCLFEGGETKALELFKKRVDYEINCFKEGRINSNLYKPLISTKEVSLSPYMRFGCLSVRKFYWDVNEKYIEHYKGPDRGDHWPAEQLFWREYFYQMSFKNEKFHQVDENPMAYKIPWDYTDKLNLFDKFETGMTGFPWIDACMRQLIQEGWIHHACRNSLAVFLTRGDLFLSWEKGMKLFLKYLIDVDWSIDSGNWNWISCGDPAEVVKEENTFDPYKHSKILDPEAKFIKKYVKELSKYPLEYVFEPHTAPLEVQMNADCLIGFDYPEPIVDHDDCFAENKNKLRQFFHSSKPEIFETFLTDRMVLKSSSSQEFNKFIYSRFLSDFEIKEEKMENIYQNDY